MENNFCKKTFYILCNKAFIVLLALIVIDILIGVVVFFKYVFWAENQGIESLGSVVRFNKEIYEKNLERLKLKTETAIANPASTYCEQQGGTLTIKTKEDGGMYGLCYFEDARACEERAMMQGECPVGGVKTTGFDTEAQRFCAWSGGETYATGNAVCTFSDGSSCLADDFYSGECSKGESIKK